MRWQPTDAEAALLSQGEAIVDHHDGVHEIVRLDALPKDLQELVDAGDAEAKRQAKRETLRQSVPRGVKISRKMAKAKGLL